MKFIAALVVAVPGAVAVSGPFWQGLEGSNSATQNVGFTYREQGQDWATDGLDDCAGGSPPRQSPIDFFEDEITTTNDLPMSWDYKGLPMNVTGDTLGYFKLRNIEITVAERFGSQNFGELYYDGETFIAKEFHFHAGAEHTFTGYRYPLEAHVVHINKDVFQNGAAVLPCVTCKRSAAVTGFFFTEGKESEFLKRLLVNGVPADGQVTPAEGIQIPVDKNFPDPNLLFENKMTWYNYEGSLTGPPCSEIVEWFVFPEPRTATREQMAMIAGPMTRPDGSPGGDHPPFPSAGNFRVTVNHLNTDAINKNVKTITGTGSGAAGKGKDVFGLPGLDFGKFDLGGLPEFKGFDLESLGKLKLGGE